MKTGTPSAPRLHVPSPSALLLALALVVAGAAVGAYAPTLLREAGPAAVVAQAATPSAGSEETGGGCFTDSSGDQAEEWVRSELFFGTTRPDGSAYGEKEWLAFLAAEVTPRFPDGLTVLTGLGQWRDGGEVIQERSHVLIILHPSATAAESSVKLEEIREAYEEQFHQTSVLRADDSVPVCTSF